MVERNTRNTMIVFYPRKKHVRASITITDAQGWAERLEDMGWDASVGKNGRLRANLTASAIGDGREVLQELLRRVVQQHEE